MSLARYTGREVRISTGGLSGCAHCGARRSPSGWQRPLDARLIDRGRRYLRAHGSGHAKPESEHELQYQILPPDPAEVATYCFGERLVDGINAVPLTRDAGGRRADNVEADMLLLVEHAAGGYRLLLVETKASSNNAFFAGVENLRQLKLFGASQSARRIFEERRPELGHPLPVTGVILGLGSFLDARGAKERAVKPAEQLLQTINDSFGSTPASRVGIRRRGPSARGAPPQHPLISPAGRLLPRHA